jgi:hypothetical protein
MKSCKRPKSISVDVAQLALMRIWYRVTGALGVRIIKPSKVL